MTYIRVIPNTIELLFHYLALLYQYHQFFTSLFCFSAWCLCCFLFNPPREKFFFQTILSCLEPFRPRGMVTNLRTIRFKGRYGSVHRCEIIEQTTTLTLLYCDRTVRSSHQRCSMKKAVLKNSAISTGSTCVGVPKASLFL